MNMHYNQLFVAPLNAQTRAIAIAVAGVLSVMSILNIRDASAHDRAVAHVHKGEPVGGFGGLQLQNEPLTYRYRASPQIQTDLELTPARLGREHLSLGSEIDFDGLDNLDNWASSNLGVKIARLSTRWFTEAGTLTVGQDWANFQDLLKIKRDPILSSLAPDDHLVSNQIKWHSPNGFSVSLEQSATPVGTSTPATAFTTDFPNLILSWQGGTSGNTGEYRITAMGSTGSIGNSAVGSVPTDNILANNDVTGWGLNLEGGWQLGDLFAALSVTYGKGIDSYVLQRSGNELMITPHDRAAIDDTLSINPSLYYSLNQNTSFHVALGRLEAARKTGLGNNDTLDTVHLGYHWNPWPSTQFDLELSQQNADRADDNAENSRVKFDAKKRF